MSDKCHPARAVSIALAAAVRCEWSSEEEQLTEPGAEFLTDLIISTTKVSLEASWELAASALITPNKMVAVAWGSKEGGNSMFGQQV